MGSNTAQCAASARLLNLSPSLLRGLKTVDGLVRCCLRHTMEAHIWLPLLILLVLSVLWGVTLRSIEVERMHARMAASELNQELMNTYEVQIVRNLGSIDQTLRVLKYALESNRISAPAALATLNQQGMLPSRLVFAVSIADRNGLIVAHNGLSQSDSVAAQRYFQVHQERDSGAFFVSQTTGDGLSDDDSHMYFTRRWNDTAGNFSGVAIVAVHPAYFTSGYERSRLGQRGVLGLFGNDGVVRIMRSGDTVSWGGPAPVAVTSVATPAATSAATGAGIPGVIAWSGMPRYTLVQRLSGYPLSAVVGLAEGEQMVAFEKARSHTLWQAGIASTVLLLITILLCLWSCQTKTRRRIRRAQDTYAAASEASLDAFFVLHAVKDESGAIVDFVIDATNSRAEKMARMSKQGLLGMALCTLLPECRSSGIFDELVQVAVHGGAQEVEWENCMLAVRARWLKRQVVAVEGGIVVILRDISEPKLAQQRILHMAHHDALTGLPNRSLIGDRLDRNILHAQRNGSIVSVAFLDLDGFKLVNDSLGHNAGDELIVTMGRRMQQCLRRSDTVGRLGGDEFVIILSDQADDGVSAMALLEKVRQAVNQPLLLCGQEVRVSCSMGVASYPRDGDNPDVLLMKADAAMYRAKDSGRNNCQFYTQEMSVKLDEKLARLEGLRNAVDNCHFFIMYQPQIDLRSGLIIGVEALIRWQHPVHGLVSPLDFIPLAEESGLIIPIGEWVIQTACRQNMAWRAKGLAPITMSVNVSPRQFCDARLVQRVAHALQDSALPPDALELEVTESLIMRDLQQSVEKMLELKAMGINLSIDDFGTGHSSLWALKSFPVSRLKIDKSFVKDLADNPDDQAITMAVIALGHKLHLRVIAEGVETEQQRSFLQAGDCDEMQGYLFSRPLPASEIALLLEKQTAVIC
jgi:diguanylate cyclase (GGDEF)-like protein